MDPISGDDLGTVLGGSLETALRQATLVSEGGVPVVTVCEAIHDLSRNNGQSIIVVGRLGSTDEGSWLVRATILTVNNSCDSTIEVTTAARTLKALRRGKKPRF